MKNTYSNKIKDVKPLNTIMAGLFPNRCDCEVFFDVPLDITEILNYVEDKRKANPDLTINFFYCFVATCIRLLCERPLLNTYVKNLNFYEQSTKSVSFVVKKEFSDEGEEAVVCYEANPKDNIDDVCRVLNSEITSLKKNTGVKPDDSKDINDSIDFFAKLPKPILKFIIALDRKLDKHNCVPKSLREGDTNFSSILLSNLGSIDLDCCFHHLNNYGANSVVIMIGKIEKTYIKNTQGKKVMNATLNTRFTIDERIADGYYFSKTFKLFQYLCNNPKLLEIPFGEPVDLD